MNDHPIQKKISDFLRNAVGSVWALDALMIIKRAPGHMWGVGMLTHELRGSAPLVENILRNFVHWGLVVEEPSGVFRYAANSEVDSVVTQILAIYGERPVTIIREISLGPSDKTHTLVDAFRSKIN